MFDSAVRLPREGANQELGLNSVSERHVVHFTMETRDVARHVGLVKWRIQTVKG